MNANGQCASQIELVDATNGKHFPSAPVGSVLLTSVPLGWRGIIVEQHRIPAEEMRDHYVVGHRLVVGTNKQGVPFGWKDDDKRRDSVLKPGDPNAGGNHRKYMVEALHGCLKRLDTDYLDLFWVHAWDELTPAEEVMRGLDDLVRAGKILYAGVSNAPAWWISHANTLAELRGWTRFVGLQIEYNLIERTPERELLPMANALGLGVTAWSPLASGLLSGKYAKGSTEEKRLEKAPSFEKLSDRNLAIAGAVEEIAKEAGKSPAQAALNWLRAKRGVIPILGARKLSQFEDNLRCLEWTLDAKHLACLDEVSRIEPGYPMDFLHRKEVHDYLHGGLFERIHT